MKTRPDIFRRWLALAAVLGGAMVRTPEAAAAGEALPTVVAIGASNTSGWGVGEAAAYPAQLEARLRACGLRVRVVNAGIPFETTNGMLRRIESDVPDGTRAVILQPGGNDLRFLGTRERRTANIAAMAASLKARGIPSVLYDPDFAAGDYQWDRIHLTAATHARIARELAPAVADLLDATASGRPTRGAPPKRGCSPAE